uniref:Uncharacterized protein n=1 Tax=Rhizophora mucronata TaxID=61149 RepID=A0A2P2P692_RHIMU
MRAKKRFWVYEEFALLGLFFALRTEGSGIRSWSAASHQKHCNSYQISNLINQFLISMHSILCPQAPVYCLDLQACKLDWCPSLLSCFS